MTKSNGGRVRIEKTRLHQYLEQLKASVFDPDQPECVVGKIAPDPDHKNSIRILGKAFTPQSVAYVNGQRVTPNNKGRRSSHENKAIYCHDFVFHLLQYDMPGIG